MSTTFILLFGFAALVLICVIAGLLDRAAFNERFPPISDEEFLSRCTSGTRPEVALKVRRIIADNLGVEYERIYPSTSFIDDLGAD